MKRCLLIAIISFVSIATTLAADKVRVSIVKQYTQDSEFILPEKVVEKKMSCLILANPKYIFTQQLAKVAHNIQEESFDHKVYVMSLKYAGAGISINIEGKDVLDSVDTKFYGDFMIDRGHFLLLENEDNKDLLKTFFKKDRSHNAIFQRAYEMVDTIIAPEPTIYQATYDERQRKINVKTHVVDGIDKLKPHEPSITPTVATKNENDSDAFDIDVELFEE